MKKTQAQILRHHGGDGDKARAMITQSYARRHDETFWKHWHTYMDVAVTKDGILLDIGAGIGQFINDLALRYPHNKVIVLEVAEYMFQQRMALPANAELLLDDITDSQAALADGSVSVAMANMVGFA